MIEILEQNYEHRSSRCRNGRFQTLDHAKSTEGFIAVWFLVPVACDWSQSRPCNKDQTSVICRTQAYPANSCSHKVADICPSYYPSEADRICCVDIAVWAVRQRHRSASQKKRIHCFLLLRLSIHQHDTKL